MKIIFYLNIQNQIGHGKTTIKTKAKVFRDRTGNETTEKGKKPIKIVAKLDNELFNGNHFKCLDAAQAVNQQYSGKSITHLLTHFV